MLNKQSPNKIDWTDYTWNPISGCKHGCKYCYMLRMEKRFPGTMDPKFRENYLVDPSKLKKSSKIFVGSSGDMWGKWVEPKWICRVLKTVQFAPRHTFQFLTKNPSGYGGWYLHENGWYGTSVDGTEKTESNIDILVNTVHDRIKFVSFEPLLKKVDPVLSGIDWVIIGANSNRGSENPPMKWADTIINKARCLNIPVWVKDNYGYPETIKEFPCQK